MRTLYKLRKENSAQSLIESIDYIKDCVGQKYIQISLFLSLNMTSLGLRYQNCKFGFIGVDLVLKLLVALGTRKQDIHPYPHGLWAGGHQIILSVIRFHAESDPLGDRLAGLMVHIHFRYRVEVDSSFNFVLKN